MKKSLIFLLIIGLVVINMCCKREKPNNNYPFLNEFSFFPMNEYDSSVSYYKDHTIKGRIKWRDSLMLQMDYYANGQLKFYSEYWGGRQMGNVYAFFQNGQIKHYNFIDEHNGVPYVIDWDSTAHIIKEEGIAISPNITSDMETSTELHIGDSISIHTNVPTPPYTKTIVYAGVRDKYNHVIDSINVPIIHNTAYYKNKVTITDSIFPFFSATLYSEKGEVKTISYYKVLLLVNK